MARKKKVGIVVEVDTKTGQQSFKKLGTSAQSSSNKIKDSATQNKTSVTSQESSLKSLSTGWVAMAAAIGVAGLAFTKFGINVAKQSESLTTRFGALLGSVTEAQVRFQELKSFANSTPFEVDQVASASLVLETLTNGVLSTGEGLRLVGDAAAVAGVDFKELAVTVGRAYGNFQSGGAIGMEVARLNDLGLISGQTRLKLLALQEAGKGKEAWGILQGELKKTKGGMEALSETGDGLESTLSGVTKNFAEAFVKQTGIFSAYKQVIKGLIQEANEAADFIQGTTADQFQQNYETTKAQYKKTTQLLDILQKENQRGAKFGEIRDDTPVIKKKRTELKDLNKELSEMGSLQAKVNNSSNLDEQLKIEKKMEQVAARILYIKEKQAVGDWIDFGNLENRQNELVDFQSNWDTLQIKVDEYNRSVENGSLAANTAQKEFWDVGKGIIEEKKLLTDKEIEDADAAADKKKTRDDAAADKKKKRDDAELARLERYKQAVDSLYQAEVKRSDLSIAELGKDTKRMNMSSIQQQIGDVRDVERTYLKSQKIKSDAYLQNVQILVNSANEADKEILESNKTLSDIVTFNAQSVAMEKLALDKKSGNDAITQANRTKDEIDNIDRVAISDLSYNTRLLMANLKLMYQGDAGERVAIYKNTKAQLEKIDSDQQEFTKQSLDRLSNNRKQATQTDSENKKMAIETERTLELSELKKTMDARKELLESYTPPEGKDENSEDVIAERKRRATELVQVNSEEQDGINNIEKIAAEKRKKLAKQEYDYKKNLAMSTAQVTAQAFQSVFNDNKEVAMATAAINTAVAVTKALGLGFPFGWAQAAAITAMGIRQQVDISRQKFADGGIVRGPGSSTSDSINASLSNGEFVMKKTAVDSIGEENLDIANEGGSLGGTTYQINITADASTDSDNLAQAVTNAIKRASQLGLEASV